MISHYCLLICQCDGVYSSSLKYLFAVVCVYHFLGPCISNSIHSSSFDLIISRLVNGIIVGGRFLLAFDLL